MTSRYKNVLTLIELSEKYDLQELTDLFNSQDEVSELAEDVAFVIISLWAMVPADSKNAFKEMLTNDIVRHQVKLMFTDGEDFTDND